MGIVAHCPAGHRIKVKDHLAGKKGICPTCGGRFRIPLAETRNGRRTADDSLPVAAFVSLDPRLAASLPPALLIAEHSPPRSGSPAGAATAAVDPPADAELVVETVGDPAEDVPVSIAEAASALWCIAMPGGTPSAAMPADAMLEWLCSGEVTGGELVWRSDWSEWRPVAETFPDHVPGGRFRGPAGW